MFLICLAGHCKRLAPTWKDLADQFKDHESVKIAHVDCTEDRDVCTTADVSEKLLHAPASYCMHQASMLLRSKAILYAHRLTDDT